MNRNKIRRTVSAIMGTEMAAMIATGGVVTPAFAGRGYSRYLRMSNRNSV